jgi:hypothetical protein
VLVWHAAAATAPASSRETSLAFANGWGVGELLRGKVVS